MLIAETIVSRPEGFCLNKLGVNNVFWGRHWMQVRMPYNSLLYRSTILNQHMLYDYWEEDLVKMHFYCRQKEGYDGNNKEIIVINSR